MPHGRERSVDVNKLNPQQAEALAVQIGNSVTAIIDEAAAKVNELLKIYGMKAKISPVIMGLNDEAPAIQVKPTKKLRKPRATKSNLNPIKKASTP